ncbi:hypothetical protein D9M68_916070 [compost metagenome]
MHEVGEAPAHAHAATVALDVTRRAQVSHGVVEAIVAPVGQVLGALAAAAQRIEVERGGVVALLDQLDLQVAGVGQRDGQPRQARRLAVVVELGRADLFLVEPWAHAQRA